MEMPTVKNVAVDKVNGITYEVMAYRQITQGEMLAAIRQANGTKKRKPKRGTKFTLITLFGLHD